MTTSYNISQLSEDLFRHESGKMIALLTKIFGTENLDLSEDVVQETFITAMQLWPLKGVPDNPSAWLFRTAKNKAIDQLRRNKFSKQIDFSDPERVLLSSAYTLQVQMDKLWNNDRIEDDMLRMMFACCHPELSMENQITLILKTLCGFSSSEIAKALVSNEDTISKRLYRTKNFFRDKKIKPAFPGEAQMKSSTESVLRAIYLIFNEGYSATHTDELIRKDLLEQALYLCKMLAAHEATAIPEVYAATALMLFHIARVNSRMNEYGEIVLLDQQDRNTWNKDMIAEGNDYMNRAAFGNQVSSYHLEAAIAYEHCIAPSFEKTNWRSILSYYDVLLLIHPNEIVALHRVIVMYKFYGAEATLREIETSSFKRAWERNHLYYALLGDLHATTNTALAYSYYQQSMTLTQSGHEKHLLEKKIHRLSIAGLMN